MKLLILTLSALVSASAFSSEVKVFEIGPVGPRLETSTQFEVNRSEGLAWVRISVQRKSPNPRDMNSYTKYHRESVPGLYFDKSTGSIMFEQEGQVIECARVEEGRFFGLIIRPTGCMLKTTVGHSDTGRRVKQVYLVTK
jgi:hypothetical protein